MIRIAKFLILTFFLALMPNSYAADVTPAGPPTWGGGYSITPTLVSSDGTDVSVAWSGWTTGGSPITGFQVTAFSGTDYSTQALVSCSAPGTLSSTDSCTVSGLPFSTSFKFKVTVTNAIGSATSALSSSAITTPSQSQTVTISGEPTSYTYGSSDFQLTASATSGLPVTWSSQTTDVCSIDGSGTVHFIKVGTCTIRATQDGSGSAYASAYDETSITSSASLSATISSATSIQSSQATLNANVPFSGSDTTPEFCISTSNSVSSSCTLPSGVTISSYAPSLVTSTSSTSVSAVASGLTQNTTYYFWIKVSASGASPYTTGTQSFTTTTGPSVAYSGSTTGTVGTAMSGTLTASSGTGVYASWLGTSLPTGLEFNPGVTANTSTVSGTPTVAGTYTALFSVTDSAGLDSQLNITFVISAAPTNNNNSNNSNNNSNNNNNNSNNNSNNSNNNSSGTNTTTDPTTVTPTKPSNTPSLEVSTITNGEIEVSGGSGGVGGSEPINIKANSTENGFDIEGLGWTLNIYTSARLFKSSNSGSLGRIVVIGNAKVFTNGSGMETFSQADTYVLTKSTWLGGEIVDKSGKFNTSYAMPKYLATGEHVFQVRAKAADGLIRTVSVPILIVPADGKFEYIPNTLISKTITKPAKTLFNIKDIPSYAKVTLGANQSSIKGLASITIANKLIYLTPNNNFSGIILVPLKIKGKYSIVERYLSLTILPNLAQNAKYAPISGSKTKITWDKVANAAKYVVSRNGSIICTTVINNCVVNAVYGPNSQITLKILGSDGVEGKNQKVTYNSNINPVLVTMVNFDNGSYNLKDSSISNLQALMKLIRDEGFNTINVLGYTDSNGSNSANKKLSEQRAKSVTDFLNGQLVGFVDSIGKSKSNPIKSNATTSGRAANRRVEILVK